MKIILAIIISHIICFKLNAGLCSKALSAIENRVQVASEELFGPNKDIYLLRFEEFELGLAQLKGTVFGNKIRESLETLRSSSRSPLLNNLLKNFDQVTSRGVEEHAAFAFTINAENRGHQKIRGICLSTIESLSIVDCLHRTYPRHATPFLPPRVLSGVILFPIYPQQEGPNPFLATILHEFQHLQDHRLLTQWISANATLLPQQRDTLFQHYVSQRDQHFEIDASFFGLFLELRGYQISHEILEHLGEHELAIKQLDSLQIFIKQKVASNVVRKLVPRLEAFKEASAALERIMRKSIQGAK